MTVYDVIRVVSAHGAQVTSYKAGEWWCESHDSKDVAESRADLFNQMCAVNSELVSYRVEETDENSPQRKVPESNCFNTSECNETLASRISAMIARGIRLTELETPEACGAMLQASILFGNFAAAFIRVADDCDTEGAPSEIHASDHQLCRLISQNLVKETSVTGESFP